MYDRADQGRWPKVGFKMALFAMAVEGLTRIVCAVLDAGVDPTH
jgi:hypothetical protein